VRFVGRVQETAKQKLFEEALSLYDHSVLFQGIQVSWYATKWGSFYSSDRLEFCPGQPDLPAVTFFIVIVRRTFHAVVSFN
jgi:hypothetical protein